MRSIGWLMLFFPNKAILRWPLVCYRGKYSTFRLEGGTHVID